MSDLGKLTRRARLYDSRGLTPSQQQAFIFQIDDRLRGVLACETEVAEVLGRFLDLMKDRADRGSEKIKTFRLGTTPHRTQTPSRTGHLHAVK